MKARILFHPRYWLIWLGFGFLWLCVQLPYRIQIALGRYLGRIALPFAHYRRKIAKTNLQACFPTLNKIELDSLLKRSFESAGIAIFEFGMAWWMPSRRFNKLIQLEGQEHLRQTLSEGRGGLILMGHFTTVEIAGRILHTQTLFNPVYRKNKNTALNWIMTKIREKHIPKVIERNDVRSLIKSLKKNIPLFYAPDQDYGRKHSVFVPFFGIPAATITATARIAKIGKTRVLPYFVHRRNDGKGYLAKIYPPLSDFPSDDVEADALRINQIIEKAILKSPEQYLWQHRRFKTRPNGESHFYD